MSTFIKQLAGAGIAWSDFNAMHRQDTPGRRPKTPIPPWAFSDEKCRAVILERLKRYCNCSGVAVPESLTLDELQVHVVEAHARRVAFSSTTGLDAKFIEKHKTHDPKIYAGRLARIIYCAYRQGMTSLQISQEFGDTSPIHVRQSLFRLNKCARVLFPDACSTHRNWAPRAPRGVYKPRERRRWNKYARTDIELAREYRLFGLTWKDIAKRVGFCSGQYTREVVFRLLGPVVPLNGKCKIALEKVSSEKP
jgi:hypothetical protein